MSPRRSARTDRRSMVGVLMLAAVMATLGLARPVHGETRAGASGTERLRAEFSPRETGSSPLPGGADGGLLVGR